MQSRSEEISRLLADYRGGDGDALKALMPLVYDELRSIARRELRAERVEHTLEPTALVHEAYLRLTEQKNVPWQNRAHFLACAAQVMRRILVDSARAHRASKRAGARTRVTLDDELLTVTPRDVDVLALDELLDKLAALNERQSRSAELRFFGGLSVEETAEVLGVSPATVKNDWAITRAWFKRELRRVASP